MKGRHSVANVKRQATGARNSASKAMIRYGRNDLAVACIERARDHFNAALAELAEAKKMLRAEARLKRMRKAA